MIRPAFLRGVTGAQRFASVVAKRSRRIVPARQPGVGLTFLAPTRVSAQLARPMAPALRVAIQLVLRLTMRAAQPAAPVDDRVLPLRARTIVRGALTSRAAAPLASRSPLRRDPEVALAHPRRAPTANEPAMAAAVWRRRREAVVARSFDRTVHRLVHRCDRLDSVTTTGIVHTRLRRAATAGDEDPTMAATAMALPVAVPVRRVLRRFAPNAVEPGQATARRPDVGEVVVSASRRIAGPPREADPPLDVERITDQVVKAIDRRLVAHRERMGQT